MFADLSASGAADRALSLSVSLTVTRDRGGAVASRSLLVAMRFRPCDAGEVYYSQNASCSPCPEKTYSLALSDAACKACPKNAVCLGGARIRVEPGY